MQMAQLEVAVHVIVPARNEEDCIGRCLQSLAAQRGIDFRITLVDDGSTDRTRMIAESVAGVEVMTAPDPEEGVSGKCNALIAAASGSQAKWLLFTDADTFHYPGSLAAAVKEAEEFGVDLLSYSPEQELGSFAERIVMPLVFADLVRVYPSERVNDPRDPVAAANGQYILIRREVYHAMGGHKYVSDKLLEDLALAKIYKASGHKIWFRYGRGMVRTRMYRSSQAMYEGWIKGLTVLFRYPLVLAAIHLLLFVATLALLAGGSFMLKRSPIPGLELLGLGLLFYLGHVLRVRRSNFPWADNLLSFLGLPVYVSLLWRSWLHSHVRGEVTWKGRTYRQSAPKAVADSSTRKGKPRLKI